MRFTALQAALVRCNIPPIPVLGSAAPGTAERFVHLDPPDVGAGAAPYLMVAGSALCAIVLLMLFGKTGSLLTGSLLQRR